VDQTLGEHYRLKKARYGGMERRYDRWMSRVFVPRMKRPRAIAASRFVREIEPQLRRLLGAAIDLPGFQVTQKIRGDVPALRSTPHILKVPERTEM
jgi:hypothetical protein